MALERLKMVFGFCLLIAIAALAIAVAVGTVEEKTSYGLMPILTILATLAGSFSHWAFNDSGDEKSETDKVEKKENNHATL